MIELKGVEVELIKPFSVLRETLERIGIANKKERKIFPSCYAKKIKGSKIEIFHFKELLKEPNMNDDDVKRRNTIIFLLMKWNLIKVKDETVKDAILQNMQYKKIFILPKKTKDEEKWSVVHKFHFETKLKTEGGNHYGDEKEVESERSNGVVEEA